MPGYIPYLTPYNINEYINLESNKLEPREFANLIAVFHNTLSIITFMVEADKTIKENKDINLTVGVLSTVQGSFIKNSQQQHPDTLDLLAQELLHDDKEATKDRRELVKRYLAALLKNVETNK